MKITLSLAVFILGFIYMPISLAMQYLLYKHVQAPDIMWVLWIIQAPMQLLIASFSEIVKKMK